MTDLDDIKLILSQFIEKYSVSEKKLALKENEDSISIDVSDKQYGLWRIVGIWSIGEKYFRVDVYDRDLSNAVFRDIAEKLELNGFDIKYVHRYTKDPILVYDTKEEIKEKEK